MKSEIYVSNVYRIMLVRKISLGYFWKKSKILYWILEFHNITFNSPNVHRNIILSEQPSPTTATVFPLLCTHKRCATSRARTVASFHVINEPSSIKGRALAPKRYVTREYFRVITSLASSTYSWYVYSRTLFRFQVS